MKAKYGDDIYNEFWKGYLSKVKLWVTEVSCSGDYEWNLETKGDPNNPKTPTAEESCQRITGQECIHGEGVVHAMLSLDSIERYSWFTLWPTPNEDHPNYESIMAAG